MERAYLRLWRDPDAAGEASVQLAELAESDAAIAEEIQRRLRGFGDLHETDRERIPLPWRLEDLPGSARQRLGRLGLDVGRGRLRSPGRLALAAGLLLGIGLALAWQGTVGRQGDLSPPAIECGDLPAPAFCEGNTEAGWVYAGTSSGAGQEIRARTLEPGDRAEVTWEQLEAQDCVVRQGETEIWRCPRESKIDFALDDWPQRRLAVLEYPTTDPAARAFARTLLESGSVDVLLLGPDPMKRLEELTGPPGPWQQDEELLWFGRGGSSGPDFTSRFEGKTVVLDVRDLVALEERLKGLRRWLRCLTWGMSSP